MDDLLIRSPFNQAKVCVIACLEDHGLLMNEIKRCLSPFQVVLTSGEKGQINICCLGYLMIFQVDLKTVAHAQ